MTLKKLVNTALIAGALVNASGCATSGAAADLQVKYYLLEGVNAPSEFSKNARLVQLKPVSVPAYLSQPNLVLLETDHRVSIAQYHSWADELPDAIRRILINELNRQTDGLGFVSSCLDCAELGLTIDSFYPTAGGQVVLTGSYLFTDGKSSVRNSFSLSEQLEVDGYEHAVAKMHSLLKRLAARLSNNALPAS